MLNRIFTTAALALMAATASLAPTGTAHAMTAEQYFADGNRLFRDDLYWAALLRYSQAAEGGLDSPLLHYNTGVAHYRAGQHIRAREHLLRAVDDLALRVAAQYNLGLNAYALGQLDEALSWFRLARDQNTDPKLQKYAVVAISRIRQEREQPTDFEVLVEEREKKREFTDLELHATIGYGSDSNVFRSPDQPYIDFSDPAQPVVVPVVRSGAFVPVSLSAKYRINSLPFEGFYGAYRLQGSYYPDEELENANEYAHELSFGSEYRRKEDARDRRVHSAFKVAQNDEVYYDPDDGLPRDVNGVVVDDRMNYLRYGPEFSARQSGEKLSFGLSAKGQLWNYEEAGTLPEYDHEYFKASAFGQFKFTSTSLLRLTADYYSRRYGDRPAFDLDGQQRQGNPNIRYDYVSLSLRARQRLGGSMWFGFDIERTERTDQYVGYNDYTRDSFGFEFHWSPGNRFDLEASGTYSLYDFPNAFAFHEPAAGRKTQESVIGELLASYRVTRHISIVAEAELRERVSNDIRIQYDRTRYLIGVRWEQ
jgi:tetratricopeptide (TPR) repeat protein